MESPEFTDGRIGCRTSPGKQEDFRLCNWAGGKGNEIKCEQAQRDTLHEWAWGLPLKHAVLAKSCGSDTTKKKTGDKIEGRETAQLVKGLTYKHEDLSPSSESR